MTVTSPRAISLRPTVRVGLTLAAVVVTIAALAVPATFYWRRASDDRQVLRQIGAPVVPLDAATRRLAARVEATGKVGPPVILAYHDVREQDGPRRADDLYTVTPEQFAAQMEALDAAGFTTITSDQLAGWLAGGSLPPRSVYLTFDDGTGGLWRHVDPILARHDFHAAAFVITGRVGTHRPYYLTWAELARMNKNGRWDLESHTRAEHDRVAVDAEGTMQPFLINRRWLPGEGRPETLDEQITRVRADVGGAKEDLAAHDLGRPRFFAYPFSAEKLPTNDPRVPPAVERILRSEYVASLSNDEPDRYVSRRDMRERTLGRMEVFSFTNAAGLLQRLAAARPLPGGVEGDPLADVTSWVDTSGRPLSGAERDPAGGAAPRSPLAASMRLAPGSLTLTPGAERWVGAVHAPGRTEDWDAYTASVNVDGLGPAGGTTSATLAALYGSATPVELTVSAGYVRLAVDDVTAAERRVPAAGHHRIQLSVGEGRVDASIDGTPFGSAAVPAGSSGGIGLGASGLVAGSPEVTFSGTRVGPPPGSPAGSPPTPVAGADNGGSRFRPALPDHTEAPADRRVPATTTTTSRRRPAASTSTSSPPATSATSPPDPSSTATTTSKPSATSSTTSTRPEASSTTSTTSTTSSTNRSTSTTNPDLPDGGD